MIRPRVTASRQRAMTWLMSALSEVNHVNGATFINRHNPVVMLAHLPVDRLFRRPPVLPFRATLLGGNGRLAKTKGRELLSAEDVCKVDRKKNKKTLPIHCGRMKLKVHGLGIKFRLWSRDIVATPRSPAVQVLIQGFISEARRPPSEMTSSSIASGKGCRSHL